MSGDSDVEPPLLRGGTYLLLSLPELLKPFPQRLAFMFAALVGLYY